MKWFMNREKIFIHEKLIIVQTRKLFARLPNFWESLSIAVFSAIEIYFVWILNAQIRKIQYLIIRKIYQWSE